MPSPERKTAIISYAHEDGQKHLILRLAHELRRSGVDATLDQAVQAPEQGWDRWMPRMPWHVRS